MVLPYGRAMVLLYNNTMVLLQQLYHGSFADFAYDLHLFLAVCVYKCVSAYPFYVY